MTIDEVEKIKTVVENKDYIVQLVNTVSKTMVEAGSSDFYKSE